MSVHAPVGVDTAAGEDWLDARIVYAEAGEDPVQRRGVLVGVIGHH
jgi:hypothetical protein